MNRLYIFLIFGFLSCTKNKNHTDKSIKVKELAHNGAWVWHSDPYVIWHNDKLFYSYVDSKKNGRIMVSSYDPNTNELNHIEVSTDLSYATDSHDHAAFAILPNKRLYIAYNRHKKDNGFFFRTSLVESPAKIEDFTEENVYMPKSVDEVTTYNNLYYLESENRLHFFGRWLNWKPTHVISDDLGRNWRLPKQIINNPPGRPYVHYCSNSIDRIDMIYTDGHPRKKDNSIYHIFYKNNSYFNSYGEKISEWNTLPIQHERNGGSVIYQFSKKKWTTNKDIDRWIPNGTAWVWDLEYDKKGHPNCVFSVRKRHNKNETLQTERIYYYFAWWTDNIGWQKKCIAKAGSALYEKENDFAGGICLNPNNPTEIFFSSNAIYPFNLSNLKTPLNEKGEYKIYYGKFNKSNKSFSGNVFHQNEDHIAIRPTMPKSKNENNALLWMEGKEYINFKKYNTSIRGVIIN